jgi:putative SOS response-associated peptidase YedK
MCYSAMVKQGAKWLERHFKAEIDLTQIELVYQQRIDSSAVRIPKAFDANFAAPGSAQERRIKSLIDQYQATGTAAAEKELFTQTKRLADAERSLKEKEAKKALESARIASDKISKLKTRLADLKRTELKPRDSRIFPMWYAPIIIQEGGDRKLVLARYHCRPQGKPELYDRKFPGLYNARRDNIEKFWAAQFGSTHAVMVVESFFENVDRGGKNAVLQFTPKGRSDMVIACLYSRWGQPGAGELLSFAAITDEPPDEVRAAGHDRMIVSLKAKYIDDWLAPQGRDRASLQAMFDDIERPYYEHAEAA